MRPKEKITDIYMIAITKLNLGGNGICMDLVVMGWTLTLLQIKKLQIPLFLKLHYKLT